MGLTRCAAVSWAWIEAGLDALKKAGLASFCNPAKTNVMPRKARNGSNAQPAMERAWGGGCNHSQLGPEGSVRGVAFV